MKGSFLITIWLLIILFLLYAFFFNPELFRHLFHYSGPGSPYVNPPQG